MYSVSRFVIKTNDLFLHPSLKPSIKNRIVLLFCNLISAKQSVRPDVFLNCLREALVNVKPLIKCSISRISLIADFIIKRHRRKEWDQDLKTLDLLFAFEKSLADKSNLINLSPEEKAQMSLLFNRLFASKEALSSFEKELMVTRQSNERLKALKTCKDLAKVLFESSVETLEKKLHTIDQTLHISTDKPIGYEEKITPQEYRFLFLATGKKALLDQIKKAGVSFNQSAELDRQWCRLELLNASPTLKKLRELALKELEQAHLFFGHRFTIGRIRDEPMDWEGIVKNIFIGSLNHVAIFTKGKTGINISHVGVQEGKHSVKPLSDPLFFAFFRLGKLNISSLLPDVSPKHKKLLSNTFLEEFERLACISRPEITFEENGPFLKTILIGHKNFTPTELSEVKFTPPQAMRCSIYVAMIFLQAINHVNKKLLELGYKETIPHPFGRYESLYRLDPLRLYYHFKRLNVIEPVN